MTELHLRNNALSGGETETPAASGNEDSKRIGTFLKGLAWLLRPQSGFVLLLIVALVVQLAFALGLPLGLKLVFDGIAESRSVGFLLGVVGVLGIALLFNTVAGVAHDYLAARIGQNVVRGLRVDMYGHLQRLSAGFFRRQSTGDLVARFSSDLPAIEYAVTRGVPLGVYNVLLAVSSIALLFFIEWRLALATLGVSVVILAVSKRFTDRATVASLDKKEAEAETAGLVQETVQGHMLVRAFGLDGMMRERFTGNLDRLFRHGFRLSFMSALAGRTGYLSVLLLMLVILAVGIVLAANGYLTVGSLIAFIGLLFNVDEASRVLTEAVSGLLPAVGALARTRGLLAEPADADDPPDAAALDPMADRIVFDRVAYTYDDGRRGLGGVSFDIAKGECVAIVGPSGCGKSTLLSLLTRVADPDEGRVTIDGTDVRKVTRESLFGRMAWVFQDSFMFDATIRENILLGKLDARDDEVVDAAKAAGLDAVVADLPDGYETMVGEGGGMLSGGQRQRIALARAFLRRPAILVLDEPTSALDPATEDQVTKYLLDTPWPCTVVMVTHRLGAAVNVDRIFVLRDGELVEQGTHDELLRNGGEYHRLWSKQSGFQLTDDGAWAKAEASRLKDIPWLADLNEEHLAIIASRLLTAHFEQGDEIIRQGREGDRFYIVVRGAVDVVAADKDGAEEHLATLEAGDYFGEIALVEDIPTTATVRARMPTVCLYLMREQFHHVLEKVPGLRETIESTIRERLKARGDNGYAPEAPADR